MRSEEVLQLAFCLGSVFSWLRNRFELAGKLDRIAVEPIAIQPEIHVHGEEGRALVSIFEPITIPASLATILWMVSALTQ
jgi:hypothetical protein